MIIITLTLIGMEILLDWRFLGVFGVGFLMMAVGLSTEKYWMNRILLGLGLIFVMMPILLTKSFWLFLMTVLLALFVFDKQSGNEMGNLSESVLHPASQQPEKYYGIQLIQPQDQQRSLLESSSLFKLRDKAQRTSYEWDDINLVYLGGNSIIDLGNTLVPAGEHTVLIRKVFGRVRLIIPHDIGLNLNISLLNGRILFESQSYPLTLENFRWRSPDYQHANRKLSLVVSSVMGDVEVIIL